MIVIDGSQGEGGGQVLRSALTLSMLTGQAFSIINIRAGRAKPGMMAQHLQSVMASAEITSAELEGAALGSQRLSFSPHTVRPGNYHFKIGTAGATTLVLQTLFLPLSRCLDPSRITLLGGTHVSWSPSYHYLEWQWLAYLARCGFKARLSLDQAGFYPRGGGQIQAVIQPSLAISPLNLVDRGRLVRIRGLSAIANLSEEIGRRQKLQALRQLEPVCRDTKIELASLPSPDKGTAIILLAEFEHSQACFSALGELSKRAETVADEAVSDLLAFMDTPAAIDPHLADQLLLPLCLASGPSTFTTSAVIQHLLTNADIIQYFLPARIDITGEIDQPGLVVITP